MASNITLNEITVFSWDIDGTMWSSFNTPFAYTVYKWIAIILFLNLFQIIFLIGPLAWIILYWLANGFLYINDLRYIFNKGCRKDIRKEDRKIVLSYFRCLGAIWHGHELIGQENIPDAPVIYYFFHGTLAHDGFFTFSKLDSLLTRELYGAAHEKEANLYGFKRAHRATNFCSFTRQEIIDRLKEGCQFGMSIGGVEESRISDNKYRVFRAKRYGLAHIAKATQVPILPIFTRNIQEAFWMPWFSKPFVKICPKKYLAALPAAGGLPVKLTTFIGKPLPYDASASPEEIMNRLYDGMQKHIDKHQIIPGNRLRALKERFCRRKHANIISV